MRAADPSKSVVAPVLRMSFWRAYQVDLAVVKRDSGQNCYGSIVFLLAGKVQADAIAILIVNDKCLEDLESERGRQNRRG